MTNFLSMANAFPLNAPFSRPFYKSVVLVRSFHIGKVLNKWFTISGGSMHLRNLRVYRTRSLIGRPGGTLGGVCRLVQTKNVISTPVVSGI